MPPAIQIENIGKRYRLGETHSRSIVDVARSMANRLLSHRQRPLTQNVAHAKSSQFDENGYYWALRDIAFDVEPGEIVGIIGRNGAGKSTLLKILSQIVSPTRGRVKINGRVASLLEVGTGFHPELTGRENVYLNGAILGMTKREVKRKFDEIVAFAEIDEFIDTPVKRYSSGMYVRLAFAVAAHLDPEILIVDEVLAVGDASFQRKCLAKIGQVGRGGRTVLFVSHNIVAIKSLCSRGVVLDGGQVTFDGPSSDATGFYLNSNDGDTRENCFEPTDHVATAEGIRVTSIRIVPIDNHTDGPLTIESTFRLVIEWETLRPVTALNLTLQVWSADDTCVFATYNASRPRSLGRHSDVCEIPGGLLNEGLYRFSVMFVLDESRPVISLQHAVAVDIHDIPREGAWMGRIPGVVRPRLTWATIAE